MERKRFLKAMALLPVAGAVFQLQQLNHIMEPIGGAGKLPVLFLGQGSPMNAIEENEF